MAESENFGPQEQRLGDFTEWYFDRMRDTYDLFHIPSGYGRDALGEASLLGFIDEQNYNRGVMFIAYAAAHQIKKASGTRAPIFAAIRENRRIGGAAAKLVQIDVEAVMRMDIGEAREMLGVCKPKTYFECLRILQAEGKAEVGLGAPAQQSVVAAA